MAFGKGFEARGEDRHVFWYWVRQMSMCCSNGVSLNRFADAGFASAVSVRGAAATGARWQTLVVRLTDRAEVQGHGYQYGCGFHVKGFSAWITRVPLKCVHSYW